jgi:hypothetical protein
MAPAFMTNARGTPARASHRVESRAPTADSLRYGTGTWEADSLGNHRAVVRVAAASDIVLAHIPWRRRDKTPQNVNVVVIAAATNERVRNVVRLNITREFGDIAFEAPTAGEYYVYYLPYTGTFKSNYPKITYRPVEQTADGAWLAGHGRVLGTPGMIAKATMVGFDAVNDFSRFTPMEYIAGQTESDSLRTRYASAPFLAFAEDRALSIRMHDDIPHVWAERGPFALFTGDAKRGEYYTFQIGVWAHRGNVRALRYTSSDLVRRGGSERIAAARVTSFNFEGVDWSGQRFARA